MDHSLFSFFNIQAYMLFVYLYFLTCCAYCILFTGLLLDAMHCIYLGSIS
jgi:hypothetical protein